VAPRTAKSGSRPHLKTHKTERAGRACLTNARRLLEDAQQLEDFGSPGTACYLAVSAQEEVAKAFLLALVDRDVVPWDKRLLRVLSDHRCKQLLCVVIDFLSPDLEAFVERCNAVVLRNESPRMPPAVADALNILRYEKIGRWASESWRWAEDPEYDRDALAIANGRQDRVKQAYIYVDIGADGSAMALPTMLTVEEAQTERERAGRLLALAERLLDGDAAPGLDFDLVREAFRILFAQA
jgi:hypothetical protein